jgi:DNA-binding CsgD family transcriptional regulator
MTESQHPSSSAGHAYRVALRARNWDIEWLERETGLSADTLAAAEECLAALGLLAPSSHGEFDFVPLTPSAALRTVLDSAAEDLARTARRLHQAQHAIQTIDDQYQPIHTEMQYTAQVELITGRLAMSRVLEDAARRALGSVVWMSPGPTPSAVELRHELSVYRTMLERGVKVRCVQLATIASMPAVHKHLTALSAAGASIRTVPALPTGLVVVDTDFAILPALRTSGDRAVLTLRGSPLINFIAGMFEHYWDAGLDLEAEGDTATEGMSQQHDEILRMLASGLRDDGIARRMGVSTRTVRRLVAEAMEQLGAQSRFQAGVRAAAQGRVGLDIGLPPAQQG